MLSDFAEQRGQDTQKPPPKPQNQGAQGEKIQPAAADDSKALVDAQAAGIEGKPQQPQKEAQGKEKIQRDGQSMPGLAQSPAQIIENCQPQPHQHGPEQRHSLGVQRENHRNSLWRKLPWVLALSS